MTLMEVERLSVSIPTADGLVQAVDDVSLSVDRGRTLAVVGESGSGKSVTCLTLMGLAPAHAEVSGRVALNGENLLVAGERRMRALRGAALALVSQDPMTSLNPALTIGYQLVEAQRLHRDATRRQARRRALELLVEVGIADAPARLDDYPHQFSGGMCQRIMIAMGLVNEPDLLIADEPTSALDVTTQDQILALLARLRAEYEIALIIVTHDLGVVAAIADDVTVMYAGSVVERAAVQTLFSQPHHPYAWGLLGSLPRVDRRTERLMQIPGTPPSPVHRPSGCRFHPRCRWAMDACREQVPPLEPAAGSPTHLDACLLAPDVKAREAASTARALAGETT